ncbi:SSS family transporter [Sphingomonas jinjuensis]|uniref:SSS family transporter n=1 Tax=Sphingomonas jinjuensis TaxID=535907 RepID=A0A840FIM2_9SPHN|nr:SSS family transporter [Sphingomonas jinjuensis]
MRWLFALLMLLLANPSYAAGEIGQKSGIVLVSIGGRPTIFAGPRTLAIDPQTRRWRSLARPAQIDGTVIAAVAQQERTALVQPAASTSTRIVIATLTDGRLVGRPLPSLPLLPDSTRVAWDGGALLAGGLDERRRSRLLRIDPSAQLTWDDVPVWPGGAALAALDVQNRARFVILSDGRQMRWRSNEGWVAVQAPPHPLVSNVVANAGQAHVLYALDEAGAATLYSYNTITDAWARRRPLPVASPSALAATTGGMLVVSLDRGVLRSWTVSVSPPRPGLAAIDLAIIAIYMLAMLAMGFNFYSRTRADNADEFFLGNRRIPFWAAGLSMFAGTIGSVNYLAYPAKSFETDWQYLMSKATYVGALIVVAIWLAPFFRRLNMVSVNTYLEDRFHLGIRLLASGLWIMLQLGARMGIILYLPALAINSMTGIDIIGCIVVVGVFTIVYTALGGMRAVVWTDVVQVFVLIGGALFAIGYIFYDVGFANVVDTTAAFHKTRAINLSFDVTQPTIWTFLVLAVLEGILCFPRDQIVMQRVLATSTPKEASWSILTFAAILMPSAILFYGIGTALFAFYRAHPGFLDPQLPIDAVFPTFIGTQLPHGVVGMVVAGVLAAAMGVLSGIINSVATLLSVDFYARLRRAPTQRQIVRFSEVASIVVGLIGMGIAILLSRLNVHSLLDLTIELGGVFGGSFAGAFPLGMFSTRTNWQGAAIGIVVSAIVTGAIWAMQAVHPYLYLAIAIFVTLVVGYLASLIFPPPQRSLDGLTVFTRARRSPPAERSPA